MKIFARFISALAIYVYCCSTFSMDTANKFVKEVDYAITNNASFSESVDIFSGSVNISHVDMLLPGNGGLDLKIRRRYSTPAYFETATAVNSMAVSKMGVGWDLDFGYIKVNESLDSYMTRDTSKATIASCSFGSYVDHASLPSYYQSPTLVTPEGNRDYLVNSLSDDYSFITKSGWRGGCGTTGFVMYDPKGTKYIYDLKKEVYERATSSPAKTYAWFLTRIEDKHGNWINFNYQTGNWALLSSISTKDVRNITFHYTTKGGFSTLTSIQANGNTITYNYDNSRRLTKISHGSRDLFKYNYTTLDTYTTLLQSITTEAGGIITYTYDGEGTAGSLSQYAQATIRQTSGNLPAKTTYYDPVGLQGGWNATKTVQVNDDEMCTLHTFHTFMGTQGDTSNAIWREGKLKSKSIYQDTTCDSNLLETTTYTYSKHKITNQSIQKGYSLAQDDGYHFTKLFYLTVPETVNIIRDGVIYTTEYSDYTVSGKAKVIEETSSIESSGGVLASRYTNKTFTDSSINYGLELPLTSNIYDSSDKLSSKVTNTYDSDFNLSSSNKNGLLFSYTYDSQGNLASSTNGRDYQTIYSSYYRGKAKTITDNIGTKTKTVDYFGNIKSETNELNQTTSYTYEDITRLKKITPPEGDTVNYTYSSDSFTVTSGNYEAVHQVDGYFRPILITETDTAANINRYQNITYNGYGKTEFTSIWSDSASETVGTTNEYDALQRATKLTTPVGDVEFDYLDNNQVKYTNLRNYTSYYSYIGYGQPDYQNIVMMEHPSSSGIVVTEIEKDVSGRILSVVQRDENAQQSEAINYTFHSTYLDLAITEEYPQFTNHFTYDAAGNNATKKVNSGSTTYFTYDARNRLTHTNYPSPMKDVTYTYLKTDQMETAKNGVGDWTFYYNNNGLEIEKTLTTNGKSYTFEFDYDGQQSLSQIDYPGLSIDYAPNAFGQATKAGTYASAVTYHAQSSIKSFTYGNGLTYSLGMHSNKVTIGSILAKSGNTQVLSKTYDYDGHGNATSIIDNLNSQYSVTNFSYDGIDRLLNATSSAWGGEVSFSYDVLGNIKTKTLPDRQLTYAYGSGNLLSSIETSPLASANSGFVLIDVGGVLAPIPFGVQASTDYFNHDTRGNITYNSRHTLTFNEADQLTAAAADSDSQSYLYDALGKRVQVIDSQGNITYEIYDSQNRMLLREDSNGDITRKIYLGNKLVASNKDGTLEYIHFDTLGSTIGVSDSSKNLDIEHYFPFGERVNKLSANNDQWYTGHKFDDYVDLSYMQGRYYDPMVGRFYSSDPVGYTAKNPVMSFNRYLYVNNNPFKYTDPDGEFLNFAVKFVADVALGAAVNYLETGEVNLGGAIKDAAIGVVDPTKTIKKAKRLGRAITGGCSFTPETMILTKDGYKSIIGVKVGDIVLSKNDETGEISWRKVTDTFKDWHTETITFTVIDENGVEETVTTTAEHPFYVDNRGWLPAGDVSKGMVISGPKADNNISIVNIQVNQEPQYAYNFTVDADHTYFVGKTNMWVHNACDFSKVPKSPTGRGSVDPGDRDPKRTYSRGETNEMLQDQGGKCAGCGETKSLSEVDGHHVQRHADGGPTTKENGAALCKDCHKEVHAKEK